QTEMHPRPQSVKHEDRAAGKLMGKVAIITGGDSGIGRAVAIAFAKEGANVSIVYLNEHRDAQQTQRMVKRAGRKCVLIAGDVGDEQFCRDAIGKTMEELGGLHVVVNNAAEQHPQEDITRISAYQ